MPADPSSRQMEAYYDRRAAEYDDWYLGARLFAGRERPGWEDELRTVRDVISSLPPSRTLDVACGTGFITRDLPGHVTATDVSLGMLSESRRRHDHTLVQADAFALPFRSDSFDRVFTGHFYGHLNPEQRTRFLAESRRIAPGLVVLDAALRDDVEPEQIQERILNDGSSHRVFKRYFTASQLADELGSGRSVFAGRWFVVVESGR
ncbi:MAG TPA: methyltransferase domain-containing protein [Actinomycetota bacterium]|nr:methyltransferase domain-containing protein [Actinomycetota bacterium]